MEAERMRLGVRLFGVTVGLCLGAASMLGSMPVAAEAPAEAGPAAPPGIAESARGFVVPWGLEPQAPGHLPRAGTVDQGAPSVCSVDSQITARPPVVLQGDTAVVGARVDVVCPFTTPLHLAIAIDVSGSMERRLRFTEDAARRIVDLLDLPGHPERKVAVVTFASAGRTVCRLTNDESRVHGCLGVHAAEGGTDLGRGMETARRELARAPDADAAQAILVMSDGGNNAGCSPVLRASSSAQARGILVLMVCATDACNSSCLRQAASAGRYFYDLSTGREEDEIAGALDSFGAVRVSDLRVRAVFSSSLSWLGSPQPPPTASAGAEHAWASAGESHLAFDALARGSVPGTHAPLTELVVTFTDAQGGVGVYRAPVPRVLTVLGAPPQP